MSFNHQIFRLTPWYWNFFWIEKYWFWTFTSFDAIWQWFWGLNIVALEFRTENWASAFCLNVAVFFKILSLVLFSVAYKKACNDELETQGNCRGSVKRLYRRHILQLPNKSIIFAKWDVEKADKDKRNVNKIPCSNPAKPCILWFS